MSAFSISEEEVKKASMDSLMSRAKELEIDVAEDMVAKIKSFMDTSATTMPTSQEEYDGVLAQMKGMPKEAIEGMFAMISAICEDCETAPVAAEPVAAEPAPVAEGEYLSSDIRHWFFTKRGHTQVEMDEMIGRYRTQFESYADGKTLSDEDMLTMLTIRLDPADITLEWCMNPVPKDIVDMYGLKDDKLEGAEITELQVKGVLITLASYKEVYGDDIVHTTPTTLEKECEVMIAVLKNYQQIYGKDSLPSVTDEIKEIFKKMTTESWNNEPDESWPNIIRATGGVAYQVASQAPDELQGMIAGMVDGAK